MHFKRRFNIVLLVTLIHLGVIGFLLWQGVIQTPQWVSAQIVTDQAESSEIAAVNTNTSTPIASNSQLTNQQTPVQADKPELDQKSVAAISQAKDDLKPIHESPSRKSNVSPAESVQGSQTTHTNESPNRSLSTKGASTSRTEAHLSSEKEGALTLPTNIGGYLHNPKPPYPEFSKEAGEQGTVVLSVMVEPNGRASSVNVVKSSGYSRLDNSARDTVRNQYRFIPAKRGNQPIAYRYQFPIVFRLKK